ncbi:MAG: stage II sporulation protein D [Dethiobacter sp.]|nr:stage II sporulation protein D [Dethiobacter sp.]
MSKILSLTVIFLTTMIIVLPALVVRGCRTEAEALPLPVKLPPHILPSTEMAIRVFRSDRGEVVTMPLEEYLVGVVAAEMPASFALEALKAQAVVARTYAVKRLAAFGGQGCDRHPGADICTDFAHCQAWEPEESSLAKWPAAEAAGYMHKIRRAVQETVGRVVVYQGRPIDAVFHANCGGHTENSEYVWSEAAPYLRGVACPYCAGSRWWETTQEFSGAQVAAALLSHVSALPALADGPPALGRAQRTTTGRVVSLRVGSDTVGGRDFRAALGLPSTNFSWRVGRGKITFTNRGFGHGVGLCQYGADGQARRGKSYAEIIRFYYRGVKIESVASLALHR